MRVVNNAGVKGVGNTQRWHASSRCHAMPNLREEQVC